MKLEYFEFNLKTALYSYIEQNFKKKDWEVIAIDLVKDKVIVKRFGKELK